MADPCKLYHHFFMPPTIQVTPKKKASELFESWADDEVGGKQLGESENSHEDGWLDAWYMFLFVDMRVYMYIMYLYHVYIYALFLL